MRKIFLIIKDKDLYTNYFIRRVQKKLIKIKNKNYI